MKKNHLKIYHVCQECGCDLNINNRAFNDEKNDRSGATRAFCKTCWSKRTPWEPECEKCGCLLKQNEENLSLLFCPVCDESFHMK